LVAVAPVTLIDKTDHHQESRAREVEEVHGGPFTKVGNE
jgi:hypothetical protein